MAAGATGLSSLSFRVARWADSGRPILIDPTGGPITPEHLTVRVPDGVRDIEIFKAAPETLAEDLDRAFWRARRE